MKAPPLAPADPLPSAAGARPPGPGKLGERLLSFRRRFTDKLPPSLRSVRLRLTLIYSLVLFGLAALLLGGLYFGLSVRLHHTPMRAVRLWFQDPGGTFHPVELINHDEFVRRVTDQALDQLRMFSFVALGLLFFASVGIGYAIAGRVLAPIGRITETARRIQATDLSQRIELSGPNDELKRLADTFDAMLARIDAAFAAQQQFLADASHELRNPLAVIRTNLDVALADEHATAEELRETATVVRRASDRMTRLVDDLLALARHQALDSRRDLVDLASIGREATDEFLRPAERRSVGIQRALPAEIQVLGDRDGLKRALANLLENAIRLSPPGAVVRVGAGLEGGWAWIAVADNGPGIAPEHLDRVFDRFWRADPGRSRRDGGTGLGLAIVRQVAEAHGGVVRLHSRVGEGSTFVLWLPAALAPAGGPDAVPVPMALPALSQGSSGADGAQDSSGAKGGLAAGATPTAQPPSYAGSGG